MRKLFITFALLLAGGLAISILLGCGGDDVEDAPPANFVSATPPGGALPSNGTITVTFDNPPGRVSVSAGTVTVSGNVATITGPFSGLLTLTITWRNGTQTLNYYIDFHM